MNMRDVWKIFCSACLEEDCQICMATEKCPYNKLMEKMKKGMK